MGKSKSASILMFLIGTFAQTQIYVGGAIGLSELVVFAIAPVVFLLDMNTLRKDGFMPVLILILLSMFGCCVTCLWHDTPFANAIRGYMANYGLWASIVVIHHLLRKDPNSFKWMVLGYAVSWVLSTFWLQSATEIYMYGAKGDSVTDGIMHSPLFWAGRIGGFVVLPYQGWYLHVPTSLCFLLPFFWGCITSVISEGSGRSGALVLMAAGLIAVVCGKTQSSIMKVSKRTGLYLICAIIGLFAFSALYRYTASNGLLGEKALHKFETQVKDAKSPLAILMAGRSEFFVGLTAVIKNPILGYGPWPIDTDNIYENWLSKYGNAEDYDRYLERRESLVRRTGTVGVHLIPTHSVILQFWVWYGIFGGVLWLYILKKYWNYMVHNMWVIPQYLGVLAMGMPMQLWNTFFSPFGGRLAAGMFISMILLTEAVRKGSLKLPNQMVEEIVKAEIKYGKNRPRRWR